MLSKRELTTGVTWPTSWTDVTVVYLGTPMSLTDAHGTVLQNAIYWWTGTGYGLGTAAPLNPWHGYWVLAYEDCQIVIPSP